MKRLLNIIVLTIACFAATSAYAAVEDGSSIETTLNDTETSHLVFMREEEKLARDTYITLYEWWGLKAFSNISKAEQSHMDALLTMLNTYGIPDPVVSNDVGAFEDPKLVDLYADLLARGEISQLEALHVGALVEEVDILDLYDAIEDTSQADIIAVYENLLAGSEKHLRAFVGQIENQGVEYIAQVMDQSEVNAILGKTDVSAFAITPSLNDAWYYPETDGQGFFITVLPDSNLVFLAWFTFDTEPQAEDAVASLGGAGQRWLTAAGPYEGNHAELTINITTGGLFDSNELEPENTPGGTIRLHFDDCNSGTVSYEIPSINQIGMVPIERVAPDNVAQCELLAD